MNQEHHYILPSVRYKRKAAIFSISVVVLVGAAIYLGFDPSLLFSDFHYVTDLLSGMLPPDFHRLWSDKSVWFSVLETISMSFLGTIFGGALAIFFAFLAAANTMPFRIVRVIVRTFLSVTRVVPSLIVILIFVVAVGLGAFAGMLTLILATIGTFGQLFTEIIENTDSGPAEAIYSVGASRMQVIRYVILPQALPSFIANLFYSFDVNLRAAIGLGIFGGGGIGFELFMAMRVLHYRDALALSCLIILLIVGMEKISDLLRAQILGENKLK